MKDLGQRAVTAGIFVIVVLGCILWNTYSMGFLFLTIVFAGVQEYYQMSEKRDLEPMKWAGMGMAGILYFSTFLYTNGAAWSSLLWINLILPFFLFIRIVFDHREGAFSDLADTILGIFCVAVPLTILNFIPSLAGLPSFSPFLILGFLVVIWANDTFAYLIGSKIGKHKLYPKVSPGKTWEGSFGGFIFAIGTAILYSRFYTELPLTDWIFLGAILSVSGTLGDLVESKIKRLSGVKDSGKLMPGHGGILDRFDAFIFCLPFVALYFVITA